MASTARGYVLAFLVVAAGLALGAAWHILGWAFDDRTGGLAVSFPLLPVLALVLGALTQPWLRPGSAAGLAAAVLAGNVFAAASSEEFDEEHLGHDPAAVLVFTVLVGALVVGSALLSHALVTWARALARQRRDRARQA